MQDQLQKQQQQKQKQQQQQQEHQHEQEHRQHKEQQEQGQQQGQQQEQQLQGQKQDKEDKDKGEEKDRQKNGVWDTSSHSELKHEGELAFKPALDPAAAAAARSVLTAEKAAAEKAAAEKAAAEKAAAEKAAAEKAAAAQKAAAEKAAAEKADAARKMAQPDDRRALTAFFHAMGGPNWKNKTGWTTDAPLDKWHGVKTDKGGRVTELDDRLNDNNLQGALPDVLGQLTALTVLDMHGNSGITSVPSAIGYCTNLQKVWFSNTSITSLPSTLGNCTSLQVLRCDGCPKLETLPNSLGELKALETLILWNCNSLKNKDAIKAMMKTKVPGCTVWT